MEFCAYFIKMRCTGVFWGEESPALEYLVWPHQVWLSIKCQIWFCTEMFAGVPSEVAPLPCDSPSEFTQAGRV